MLKIDLKIRRQDSPKAHSYWQRFRVPSVRGMTLHSVLKAIEKQPVTDVGERVSPVVWEEFSPILVNGAPKIVNTTCVDDLKKPLVLEPLTKFPVLRDLVVDRAKMLTSLEFFDRFVPFDGPYASQNFLPADRKVHPQLFNCVQCGACLEVCPRTNERSHFMGAAAMVKARLVYELGKSADERAEILDSLLQKGGIEDCGNFQHCQSACPTDVPILETLALLKRQTTKLFLKKIFG